MKMQPQGNQTLESLIRPGDAVTILNYDGKRCTGRAVMPCSAGGWVLNMGGKYGTPGIANSENIVAVRPSRRTR